MKYNAWTLALIGAGVVSLPAMAHADENTNTVVTAVSTTNAVLTALSATTISGYVDTSAHWNPGSGTRNLPVYTPNGMSGSSEANGFNLDVVALTINKPVGEGDWGAGYNVTLLFGPEAVNYNNAAGTPGPNGPNGSDFALKDTYVDLHVPLGNGLDVKLGTFTEILGYEVYETGNNPNYTRSYGYEIEPTALTGMLLTYQFSPIITAQVGVANTWSAGVNARNSPPNSSPKPTTAIGGVTLTAPESMGFLSGSTLSGGIINGYDAVTALGLKTSLYVGGTFKTPVKCLSVGLAYDYTALGNNTGFGAPQTSGYQNATAGYLLWQATEKLAFNTRADYFTQSDYMATAGMPPKAFALSETVQYDLWKNVVSRVEFRWDNSVTGVDAYGGTASNPLPNSRNAFLLAANIIYKF